jgi:hypothetical protein
VRLRRLASITRRSLLATVLLAPSVVAVLVATGSAGPGAPGVTRDAAIRVARNLSDAGATSLVSAVVQHDVVVTWGGNDIHQWVWLVTFRGQWHLMCGAISDTCDPTTEWVAIDYSTGAWVRSEFTSPAG